MTDNPITESIDYLIDCGWSKEQATNLCKAIHSNSGEHLWEIAPEWIQHCGECKKYVDGLLGTVASGLVNVTKGDDSWFFKLSDQGKKVGEAMFGDK